MIRMALTMFRFLVLCTFIITTKSDNIGDLLPEIFYSAENDASENCVCVPFFKCRKDNAESAGIGVIDIRSTDGPCENYLQVCCAPVDLIEDTNARPIPEATERVGCGKRNPEGVGFRIAGEENGESEFGEFPWMIAVHKKLDIKGSNVVVFQCGGSLIHPQVVMTAAHCVKSNASYEVRAGEWDTQMELEILPHQDMKVNTVVIHPKYYAGALFNDIALLFLESPVKLSENVDVVCLPLQNEKFEGARCVVSGWGSSTFGEEASHQNILKKVELPVISNNDCQRELRLTRLGPKFTLDPSFMCAGSEKNRDACDGDGGSPLVCPIGTSGRYAQTGIVSWGIGCGGKGTPGVYSNVAGVRAWIDKQLESRGFDPKQYQF